MLLDTHIDNGICRTDFYIGRQTCKNRSVVDVLSCPLSVVLVYIILKYLNSTIVVRYILSIGVCHNYKIRRKRKFTK